MLGNRPSVKEKFSVDRGSMYKKLVGIEVLREEIERIETTTNGSGLMVFSCLFSIIRNSLIG
jgi:hypothetical protein